VQQNRTLAGDICFLVSINHDMQEHVIPFNMVPLFLASLSRLHRDARAVTAVETFRYVHQPSLGTRCADIHYSNRITGFYIRFDFMTGEVPAR
jgi:hypothetical protein